MNTNLYREIAAGALIYDPRTNSVLLGKSPGQKSRQWTVFKGKMEGGETLEETAIRETEEESSLKLNSSSFIPIIKDGRHLSFDYVVSKSKFVRIFCWEAVKPIDPQEECSCRTFFEDRGVDIPEIVNFRWFSWDAALVRCFASQLESLKKIRSEIESAYHIERNQREEIA